MDAMTSRAPDSDDPNPSTAFQFTGNWREFAPIALTNLLLTIVTLGIYRFWATARTRRYLWSRTRFIDDRLEWTGTGREMFRGFLFVMAIFLPLVLILQFGLQAMILRGHVGLAMLVGLACYIGILYLVGLALFRALRYRLSRTYWHGIRGGSDDSGWRYARSALWKPIVGILAFGLLIPRAMVSLWNQRWSVMQFGPHRFSATGSREGLMLRWLLIYGAGIAVAFLFIAMGAIFGLPASQPGQPPATSDIAAFAIGMLLYYLVIGIVGVHFYAGYYARMVQGLSLGDMRFDFTATTADWLKLILGNMGLVIVTLGVGLVFIGYRNWSFVIRHFEAFGNVDLALFTQTTASSARDAEGLASLFDIGAI